MARFFDSWGKLFETCDIGHPEAVAFGPTGAARKCSPQEVELLAGRPRESDETDYAHLLRAGIAIDEDEDGYYLPS